jgi:hypothetical protein
MDQGKVNQEFKGDRFGVTSKVTINSTDVPLIEKKDEKPVAGITRKQVSELSQNEIAEMFFEMIINHRIMESRIEKLENGINVVSSLLLQKGFSIPS